MADFISKFPSKRCELFVGQVFRTFAELENTLQEYGRENHMIFVKENCKKSKFAEDEYDYINLVCKQGGRRRKSTSKGIRANLRTIKCGCPVTVRATSTKCTSSGRVVYQLTRVILEHNHEVSELTYKSYAQNRRPCMTESLQSLLECKSVSNLDIQLYIEQTQGKTLLGSDLRNLKIKQNLIKTKTTDVSDVKQFIDSCVSGGGYVDYGLNENTSSFEYLVYMSNSMKMLISQFPEVLIIDATYESNRCLLPLLTIMCIDNSGAVHPVLHAFVQNLGENLTGKCFQFLSERYENTSTKTFFVGKHISEVSAIKSAFPHSDVLLYHSNIKQAVKNALQEIGVPADLLRTLQDLFDRQAGAITEEEYVQLGTEIKNLASTPVAEYFESHWWSSPQMWAAYINLDIPELHLSITNHIESYHRKIKSLLNSKLGLGEALELLTKYDNHLFHAAATRMAVEVMKSRYNSKDNDSVVDEIYNDVTSFAAKLVVAQYKLAKNFDYFVSLVSDDRYEIKSIDDSCHSTTLNSCNCKFFMNLKLQCRHMFVLRNHLDMPLYQRVSDEHRFSKKLLVPLLSSQHNHIAISGVDNNNKILSLQQKNYLVAEKLLKDFSLYLSVLDTQAFKTKTEQLQMLLRLWKNNEEVEFKLEPTYPNGSGLSSATEHPSGLPTESEPAPDTSTEKGIVPLPDTSVIAVTVPSTSNLIFSTELPTASEEVVKSIHSIKHVRLKLQREPQAEQDVSLKRIKTVP